MLWHQNQGCVHLLNVPLRARVNAMRVVNCTYSINPGDPTAKEMGLLQRHTLHRLKTTQLQSCVRSHNSSDSKMGSFVSIRLDSLLALIPVALERELKARCHEVHNVLEQAKNEKLRGQGNANGALRRAGQKGISSCCSGIQCVSDVGIETIVFL